jgi:hypothetical protein
MSKTIAIIQSNYIPWKGYFDIIDMTKFSSPSVTGATATSSRRRMARSG